MSGSKMWGSEEFWGLGYDFDPQWVLTPAQQELQARLIDLCHSTLRDNAVESEASRAAAAATTTAAASPGATSNRPRGTVRVGRS